MQRGQPVVVGEAPLDLESFAAVCAGATVSVSASAIERAGRSERQLAEALGAGAIVYGVTTAYGAQSGRRIEPGERQAFQLATVRSHACGSGPPLDRALARGCWLAKLCSLAAGRSGASVAVLGQLAALLNAGLWPLVPSSGSLGASGDLIPSGHAALPLVGEGVAFGPDGATMPGAAALELAGIEPLTLGPRDGLSLVNGTAATTSLAVHACVGLDRLVLLAEVIAAAGLVAIGGHLEAFSPLFTLARPQPGAAESAEHVRALARGAVPSRRSVHDPYAWRCLPQVHGAARSASRWAREICEAELASCTDNPLLDDTGKVLSGGNFHGAPLGLAMDTTALAVGQLASLSRQRLAALPASAGETGGGLEQTMLLTSSTAAVLELSAIGPATRHWLPVDGVEDHVANSTLAGRQALVALERARHVLACEARAIAGAIAETGAPSSPAGRALLELVREMGPVEGTPADLLGALASRLDGLLDHLDPDLVPYSSRPRHRPPTDRPTTKEDNR